MKRRWIAAALAVWAPAAAWGLSVTAGRTTIRVLPGKTAKAALAVSNDAKEDVQVDVSKKDWFILAANKGLTVDQWLTVDGEKRFILKTGERREILIQAVCPKEA